MLRLANYYPILWRNDGNPLYVTAALKRREAQGLLKIDHLQPFGDMSHWGTYDAHIWVDWGEDGLGDFLPEKPIYPPGRPLIYWASDTHLGPEYRYDLAKLADIRFFAQTDALEKFKEDTGLEAHWLPHAFEPRAYNDADDPTGTRPYNFITKKYDVCFVGHINSENRILALDRLFKEFPNFYYGQRLFNEAAEKFAQSKIVFNIAMKGDVNMRCFEAMGSKSFLLTDRLPDLEKLFVDGKHCVFYDNLDDMVAKAKYYIEHDAEREAIAQAGYEEVMKNHKIDNRVDVMLEKLEEYLTVKKEK